MVCDNNSNFPRLSMTNVMLRSAYPIGDMDRVASGFGTYKRRESKTISWFGIRFRKYQRFHKGGQTIV